MSTIRSQAVKLGLFVTIVVAILFLALFLIGGLSFLKPVHRYHVVSDEAVSGIDINSAVTMRGVAIGKVRAIDLDRSDFAHVEIELEIDPDIKIPVGSKAYFERVGLTGERVIDISGGTLADGELAPGSALARGQTELERLESRGDELGDELTALIADVTETVQHIDTLVEAIDPSRIESIVAQTERSTKTIAFASAQLQHAVVEGRVDMAKITQQVDRIAGAASTVLAHTDSILKASAPELRAALHDLRQASQDAKLLARELRVQPSLLLRSKVKKPSKKHKRR